MTEEEFFISNYPDSCYGGKPLSPHWDYFEAGVEFGERQSEEKIKKLEQEIERITVAYNNCVRDNYYKTSELEKENAELKDYRLETMAKEQTEMSKYAVNLENKLGWYDTQLTKAKEILKEFVHHYKAKTIYVENMQDLLEEAEQFLKDNEVEK